MPLISRKRKLIEDICEDAVVQMVAGQSSDFFLFGKTVLRLAFRVVSPFGLPKEDIPEFGDFQFHPTICAAKRFL
jgi:hypothetical protein